MNKRAGSLLCLGMAVSLFMQGITVHADDTIKYPSTLEKEAQDKWETPSGVAAEDFETICDEEFEKILGKNLAGGAMAVVSQGEVVFSKGYGYADVEKEIPFLPSETVFEYGSVSKLFTWTSAMQMKEQGKLDLNANIDEYLPDDFQRVDDKNKPLSMLQLMNHQAGYDDYLIHLFNREDNMVSLKEALEEHKVSQVYEPGFASSYSNYGAGLAGYVVENLIGEQLYQYMEKGIFEPLGMEHTRMNPDLEESLKAQKSKAYKVENNELIQGNWSYISMYPAGSINGTLDDLAKFAIAYLEKNPVIFKEKDTFEEMLSPSYEIASGAEGIAHGFIEFDGEYPAFWHNGGTENFYTFFAVVPEADFAIMACGNTEAAIRTLQPLCFSMLEKRDIQLDKTQENLPDIAILEGDYQDYREAHKGILQVLSLFRTPIHVEVSGENRILVDDEEYIQIEPYVFQCLETGRKCGFLVEDGKVVKFSMMLDYLPVSPMVTVRNYATYGVLLIFLFAFIVAWIRFIVDCIQKRKNPLHKFFLVENGMSAMLVADIFIIINKITSWDKAADFAGYQIANHIIALLLGCLILLSVIKTRKVSEKGSFIYRAYGIVLLILLCVAACWGLV